jgi:predicted TIM-barrel fold metal-dependent hydrolase
MLAAPRSRLEGWADATIAPGGALDYYNEVVGKQGGGKLARDSVRLFMVPGMGYCPGRNGAENYDIDTLQILTGARMVTDHKGRFGLFAVLPLPDIDASLKEIGYALDTLKADGVGMLTSYGDVWLGEKRLQPVFDELNRRGAIVYTHPTDAACCHSLANANPATVEWFVDTARSINSLLNETGPMMGGQAKETSAATRYGNIKFIWSHAGGALLGVVSRVVGTVSAADLAGTPKPNSKLYHIRRFYYDTAGSANPIAMQGLKTLAGASQIVFGTDVPYGTSAAIGQALELCGLSREELRAINRENALRILPKYS